MEVWENPIQHSEKLRSNPFQGAKHQAHGFRQQFSSKFSVFQNIIFFPFPFLIHNSTPFSTHCIPTPRIKKNCCFREEKVAWEFFHTWHDIFSPQEYMFLNPSPRGFRVDIFLPKRTKTSVTDFGKVWKSSFSLFILWRYKDKREDPRIFLIFLSYLLCLL